MKKQLVAVVTLIALCFTLAACGETTGGTDTVNLIWYFVGSEQRDLDEVNEKVNEITKEKIGASVDLKLIDWNAYDQKMNMIISTGEEFDLCWTAPQTNDYYNNVARNAFLPLDDLLNTYGKHTYEAVEEKFWNATRINGKIYGVINYQTMATAYGFATPRTIADASGIYYGDIDSYQDLEPYLAFIKQAYPDKIPLGYNKNGDPFTSALPMYGFDVLGSNKSPGVVRFDDPDLTVINQYDTQEFYELITTMRRWYQQGYIKADAPTSEEYNSDCAAGKYGVLWPAYTLSDTTEDDRRPNEPYGNTGIAHYVKRFTPTIISTDRALATMTAISSTSKHPEKAMELIELINTDPQLYNLICYGIEGKHYNRVDYTNDVGAHVQVEPIENSGYAPNTPWMFGNTENLWLTKIDIPHSEWKKFNETSMLSPTLGFSFNADAVSEDVAICNTVIDEYLNSLVSGSVDIDQRYQEFLAKLREAGVDNIISEKQRQLDEWVKDNRSN